MSVMIAVTETALGSMSRRLCLAQVAIGRLTRAFALVACLVPGASLAGDWLTDHDEALEAARESGRPVLTVFTGSDWCPHCVTLEKNVLESAEFRAWAEERVVLLMIDMPKSGISRETRQARSRVCLKYGVQSFPSTVLATPEGDPITVKAGYSGESPATWIAALGAHLPATSLAAADGQEPDSLEEAVATARAAKRPILLMVSRKDNDEAQAQEASLISDPEFDALARDNFVVARLPADPQGGVVVADPIGGLVLDGEQVMEVVVTEDGRTAVFSQSGESPQRVVSGLRRFLAGRQARHGNHPRR